MNKEEYLRHINNRKLQEFGIENPVKKKTEEKEDES